MKGAYAEALCVLLLSNGSDPLTELVAIHIVALTKTGERDPSIMLRERSNWLAYTRRTENMESQHPQLI
jgi:hypothetical protein